MRSRLVHHLLVYYPIHLAQPVAVSQHQAILRVATTRGQAQHGKALLDSIGPGTFHGGECVCDELWDAHAVRLAATHPAATVFIVDAVECAVTTCSHVSGERVQEKNRHLAASRRLYVELGRVAR